MSDSKEKVEYAYNQFLEVMNKEGYVYYDTATDVEIPPEPSWVEILRTGENYITITYAVPEPNWKEIKDA